MRRVTPALAGLVALAAGPAGAQHRVAIGSVDRLRVIGPVAVTVTTGRSPAVQVAGDPARVAVEANGDALVVRRIGAAAGEAAADLPAVTVQTPMLHAVSVDGEGRVAVDRMTGGRLVLVLNGPGTIAVAAVDAEAVEATAVGDARITLAGRAARARLVGTGAAQVDAGALATDELTLRLDGGEMRAQARYAATVTALGKARATVLGHPVCTVRAPTGAVTCGAPEK